MIRLSMVVFLICVNSLFGQRFGGIEIGAKGIKWIAIELDLQNARNAVKLIDSGDQNTTLSALAGSEFDVESVKSTVEAVGLFYDKLLKHHKISQHNIFVVASSGLPKAENLTLLIDGVKKSIGQPLDVLSVEDEVRLGIHGLCLQKSDRLGDALFIDVGSGNTKGGYIIPRHRNKIDSTTLFHLPGTVTLTTAVKEIAKNQHIDFVAANAEAKDKLLMPTIRKQLNENRGLESRRLVYMNGGIVWAISTFLHPDMNQHANVPLTLAEFRQMRQLLQQAKGDYPKIDVSGLDAAAKKEIAVVKKVFSPENLAVGNEILCTLGETLDFQKSEVFFVRNGRIAWLLGYVSEKGHYAGRNGEIIAKKS